LFHHYRRAARPRTRAFVQEFMSNSTFTSDQLQSSAEQAIEHCSALGADSSESLVQAWVTSKNAAAVQAVADHGEGKARKAARRGLNVLKSKGVVIPQPLRVPTQGTADSPVKAWLLPPDGNGVRVLGLAGTVGGQQRGCIAFLRDGQGVFKLECSTTTPSKLFGAMKNSIPGLRLEPVAVPLDWARAKIANCRQAMAGRKVTEPMGFMSARQLIEPAPASAPEHPFEAEGFAFSSEDAKAQATDSGVLHHLPEFQSWLPPQNAVQQMLAEVGKHLTPGQEPDPAQVAEHLKAEMLAATDRTFTPEVRADVVQWMKDAGISIMAREGEALGLKLAATIQCIESAGLVTDPPQAIPFLRAFFEKAVQLLMARNGGRLNIPMPKQA
jgi:hypothetical protein